MWHGLATGRGQAIVALGLVILIATPIMRVAISLVGFGIERDYVYATISAIVLALLMLSFFLGAGGSRRVDVRRGEDHRLAGAGGMSEAETRLRHPESQFTSARRA